MAEGSNRTRYALVGVGNRGTTMWGRELLAGWGDYVELVGICDLNPMRAERARAMIGTAAPLYADFPQMMAELKPQLVVVCTPDDTHDDIIVEALEAGADVISEKPLTTTAEKIERIRAAEQRTGRRVDVSFNYRFAPTAARIKELIDAGAIGEVVSVDFHWYLDNQHGADYFRRWHAFRARSGSLFVHKATHHFDLLNWYLDSDPVEVKAFGELLHYGRKGPFRGERCRTCPHKARCDYYLDLSADPFLDALYEEPSAVDGYFRDACVYREEIDIPDTMTATIRYASGVQVSYSLNTYMPVEGHHIAFNGHRGRIELRQYEKQPWEAPAVDEILLIRSFGGGVERIRVPHEPGGHYGGDNRMRDMIFRPGAQDRLRQRAGSRAGAMSVLCGIAALESATKGGACAVPALPA
ncbi:Gfo/Idh/MocA family oxidoreductase [Chelatococcus daeguensis]|uniref:Oxidoreductase family, C-terminal alpha/beta domain/Oxidoreductase family, NAD-binding Rossmann fold n=1 Tax=Chelatococcus sambhunathii TaxID=363953 RepID=A0ABM9U9Z7_9HYPH|nr:MULTISPECIES: Gfo/Idh/MocA family oxidoreductase [Chelatococcus]KZE28284.1 4,5-dihydroxyphthalate dehydrogenase [Chelatococcus daeguensis]MBM3084352.1 Gfo/Idh/MocA family oxidoreductase [Chelatococcus daeguensis]CUA89419.1 Oxidoreductase family, C-terminal alpha/beta domain/Oxidoreductase family, NAD-binding Rossmann fold [Chelatococcus sambhunathii]